MGPGKNGFTGDRRRTIRIKRSALLRNKLDDIDRPAIKIAESRDELEQAFSLVYQEYQKLGYITEPDPSQMSISIYNFLPETAVFIFKSYLTVISTLTQVFDSKLFGLPMDVLYRDELAPLRDKDRKLVEIVALATTRDRRWRNVFMYLTRAMFWYALYQQVNDLCITVNPKHVEFYKTIFLFEDLGPEKHYPKVNAPAVALRLNLDDIHGKLKQAYSGLDFDCQLDSYYERMATSDRSSALGEPQLPARKKVMEPDTAKYFLGKANVLDSATSQQAEYLRSVYPGV